MDAATLKAERKTKLVAVDERGRKKVIDGGYTGKITQVNSELLKLLLENGYVPIVTPIALSQDCEPLNVDGDRTAAIVAAALKADRLILLTDVKGLMLKGECVPKIAATEVKEVLSSVGAGHEHQGACGVGGVKRRRQRGFGDGGHRERAHNFSVEPQSWDSDNR